MKNYNKYFPLLFGIFAISTSAFITFYEPSPTLDFSAIKVVKFSNCVVKGTKPFKEIECDVNRDSNLPEDYREYAESFTDNGAHIRDTLNKNTVEIGSSKKYMFERVKIYSYFTFKNIDKIVFIEQESKG